MQLCTPQDMAWHTWLCCRPGAGRKKAWAGTACKCNRAAAEPPPPTAGGDPPPGRPAACRMLSLCQSLPCPARGMGVRPVRGRRETGGARAGGRVPCVPVRACPTHQRLSSVRLQLQQDRLAHRGGERHVAKRRHGTAVRSPAMGCGDRVINSCGSDRRGQRPPHGTPRRPAAKNKAAITSTRPMIAC